MPCFKAEVKKNVKHWFAAYRDAKHRPDYVFALKSRMFLSIMGCSTVSWLTKHWKRWLTVGSISDKSAFLLNASWGSDRDGERWDWLDSLQAGVPRRGSIWDLSSFWSNESWQLPDEPTVTWSDHFLCFSVSSALLYPDSCFFFFFTQRRQTDPQRRICQTEVFLGGLDRWCKLKGGS